MAWTTPSTWASGDWNLQIRDNMNYLYNLAGVVICTSSTRPASPLTGAQIYETNTGALQVWTGSAWVRINKVQKAVTFNFTASWTPPAGVTYAIAEMAGGGGGSTSGIGSSSTVAFTSGTVTAVGGAAGANLSGMVIGSDANAGVSSASAGSSWGYNVPSTYGSTLRFASTSGSNAVVRRAGGTCTPGVALIVTVGAGGSGSGNGGSGWVTILYEE